MFDVVIHGTLYSWIIFGILYLIFVVTKENEGNEKETGIIADDSDVNRLKWLLQTAGE